ncbi:MAG: nucleotidyltransferase family protein [Candidatus Hydrogenedentes bacterium]|nr:nucleotidyltransferase family protein [Candidatus Hydrogenedentota bacterium]
MKTGNITIPDDAIRAFCAKHRIAKLSLFGSVLRDDFTPLSDVDVLVEFAPGKRIGLSGFAEIEIELSDLLGRKVDLSTPSSLSRYFRDEVLREAETLNVAA